MQDIDGYIQEGTRQLEDTNFQKINDKFYLIEYNKKIKTVIDNFKKQNLITKKQQIR